MVQQEGVDLSVLHWDTTAIYLEGEYDESDLAAYGHSRDHRDNKQVKVGLDVTSRERVPLLYRLLNGATADVSTPVPNLAAIAAFLRQPECATLAVHPLVVGDCKMITPAAVAAAHQHHLYYLGPWESTTTVQAVIRSVNDAELAAHELSYRPQRRFPADQPFVPYRGVWRPFPGDLCGPDLRGPGPGGVECWQAAPRRAEAQAAAQGLAGPPGGDPSPAQPGSLHPPGVHGAPDRPGPARQLRPKVWCRST